MGTPIKDQMTPSDWLNRIIECDGTAPVTTDDMTMQRRLKLEDMGWIRLVREKGKQLVLPTEKAIKFYRQVNGNAKTLDVAIARRKAKEKA